MLELLGTVLPVAEVAVAELSRNSWTTRPEPAFALSHVAHVTASAFSFWICFSVLPSEVFHATRPLAALPTSTPAAVEGEAKRKSWVNTEMVTVRDEYALVE